MPEQQRSEWQLKVQAARTLLPRLDAGDDLHREAAAEIQRLRQELRESYRDAERDAREAYSSGRFDEIERSSEGW